MDYVTRAHSRQGKINFSLFYACVLHLSRFYIWIFPSVHGNTWKDEPIQVLMDALTAGTRELPAG